MSFTDKSGIRTSQRLDSKLGQSHGFKTRFYVGKWELFQFLFVGLFFSVLMCCRCFHSGFFTCIHDNAQIQQNIMTRAHGDVSTVCRSRHGFGPRIAGYQVFRENFLLRRFYLCWLRFFLHLTLGELRRSVAHEFQGSPFTQLALFWSGIGMFVFPLGKKYFFTNLGWFYNWAQFM